MRYFEECIREAFEEAELKASEAQIMSVVECVEGAHESKGQATGEECIPNPLEAEIDELKRKHSREVEDLEHNIHCYRKSVAARHNVDITEVHLDGENVMVERKGL